MNACVNTYAYEHVHIYICIHTAPLCHAHTAPRTYLGAQSVQSFLIPPTQRPHLLAQLTRLAPSRLVPGHRGASIRPRRGGRATRVVLVLGLVPVRPGLGAGVGPRGTARTAGLRSTAGPRRRRTTWPGPMQSAARCRHVMLVLTARLGMGRSGLQITQSIQPKA